MSKLEKEENGPMFDDIRELCICCAKSIIVIANRHKQNPRLVSKLFIEVYKKINDDLENGK